MKTKAGNLKILKGFLVCTGVALLLTGCAELNVEGVKETGTCTACHEEAVNNFRIHQTHVSNDRMQRSSLMFNSELSASTDDLAGLPDSLIPPFFRCDLCHQGYGIDGNQVNDDYHQNGKTDVVFNSDLIAENFSSESEITVHEPEYNGESCSAVSCHGPGRMGKEGIVWNEVFDITAELDCHGCHDTRKHRLVDDASLDCSLCHLSARDSTNIGDYTRHYDGVYGEDNESLESCSRCHVAINEITIHRSHLSVADMKKSPLEFDQVLQDSLSGGMDQASLPDSLVPKSYYCGICHPGYGAHGDSPLAEIHRSGMVDLELNNSSIQQTFHDTAGIISALPAVFRDPQNGPGCSTVACHSPGRAGIEDIVWSDTVYASEKLDCNGCHNNTRHKVSGGKQKRCGVCHISAFDKTAVTDFRTHINGVLEIE